MNMILSLARSPLVRSYILAAMRHAATFVSGLLLAWLLKHGVDNTDAVGVAQDIGGLVIFGASIAFSMLDVKSVDSKVNTATTQGAATAAAAISTGQTTPQAITAASGTPDALKQLLATLQAGQE